MLTYASQPLEPGRSHEICTAVYTSERRFIFADEETNRERTHNRVETIPRGSLDTSLTTFFALTAIP